MTREYNPSDEDTTQEDVWAALADESAELWRGLDTLQLNTAAELRKARAAILAGKLDTVSDPGELLRAARWALETLGAGKRIRPEVATLGALAAGYWARIAEQRDAMPTGLAKLDKALGGGFQARRLMVLLGAPGSGKTTLANQVAEHIADSGRPVVYLTTEDTPAALLAKTMARLYDLDYGAVLQGREGLQHAINGALESLRQRKSAEHLLYIEDPGGLTLPDLRELARAHLAQYAAAGSGVLVIDYLQRWARAQRGANGQREELRETVGRLTEELRAVARELNCSVLALASQNRASGYGKNSDKSALASAKESGDVEYSADVVMALSIEEDATAPLNHKAGALRIDKNRLGETRKLDYDWYPSRQTWTEASK